MCSTNPLKALNPNPKKNPLSPFYKAPKPAAPAASFASRLAVQDRTQVTSDVGASTLI